MGHPGKEKYNHNISIKNKKIVPAIEYLKNITLVEWVSVNEKLFIYIYIATPNPWKISALVYIKDYEHQIK